jgi:hypothetical protein
VASIAIPTDFVDALAAEIAVSVEQAVECWMSQIEQAVSDPQLTSLGRLYAVYDILDDYKRTTGKSQLSGRASLQKMC